MILASASPRRSELLGRLGLAFEVVPSTSEEERAERLSKNEARAFVEKLAKVKADEVAANANEGDLILAADTIVWLDGEVLGKPKDDKEAETMLARLGGREHHVYTGVALVQVGKGLLDSLNEVTRVHFYPLTVNEIKAYVATGEPLDKAGGYGAQGFGGLLIERIEGDYFNVVGLPVGRVYRMLRNHGIDCLAASEP